MPVTKNVGDKVIGATVNKNGYIEYTAEKIGEDTAISQIIKLVEEAQAKKLRSQDLLTLFQHILYRL